MIRFTALAAVCLVAATPGLAFDDASQGAIDTLKRGKAVPIGPVTTLMMGAETWCYNQTGTDCAWSDTYLAINGNQVSFELSHPWSESLDISYVSQAVLRDGRFICYSGYNWIPSVRAYTRPDGIEVGGRDLAALKLEIEQWTDLANDADCFDYVFEGRDDTAQTLTLLQRQWIDGETDAADDATVTLHFDKATADGLGWYW
jgi:hypothetical protein